MAEGYLTARVYTSGAILPLANAAVVISRDAGGGMRELLSFQHTDLSGKTFPVPIPAPPTELSQSPGSEKSFSVVDLTAYLPLFNRTVIRNVPIFPGITSEQDVLLIPQSDNGLPGAVQTVTVTPQDL